MAPISDEAHRWLLAMRGERQAQGPGLAARVRCLIEAHPDTHITGV
jgi:hypothetical protein